jgi:membrane protease YdiL (CAAX protease family)
MCMHTATESPWDRVKLVAVGLGVAVGGFVVGIGAILVLAVLIFGLGVELSEPEFLIVSLIGLQGIGFPTVGYAYIRYTGRSLRTFVPVRVPGVRDIALIVGGWFGALMAVGLVSYLIQVLGLVPAQNSAGQVIMDNPGFVPYLIPFVFLLNGPGEEFLFRGVLQGRFREAFGPVGAIVLATLMFAPMHIFSLQGGLEAALVTISVLTVPSLVFGALYEYSGNFVVPALVHGLYNATLFGSIYLAAEYGPETQQALLIL